MTAVTMQQSGAISYSCLKSRRRENDNFLPEVGRYLRATKKLLYFTPVQISEILACCLHHFQSNWIKMSISLTLFISILTGEPIIWIKTFIWCRCHLHCCLFVACTVPGSILRFVFFLFLFFLQKRNYIY